MDTFVTFFVFVFKEKNFLLYIYPESVEIDFDTQKISQEEINTLIKAGIDKSLMPHFGIFWDEKLQSMWLDNSRVTVHMRINKIVNADQRIKHETIYINL